MTGGPYRRLSRDKEGGRKVGDMSTHQTFTKLSSEALMRTLPEAVSAQQQLFTSSAWAAILTVRLSARRS